MLWTVLKKMVVSDVIVQLLRNLYSGQQAAVRMEGEVSTWFTVVHQEGSKAGMSRLSSSTSTQKKSFESRQTSLGRLESTPLGEI